MQNTRAGLIPQLEFTDSDLFWPEGLGPTQAIPGSDAKLNVLCRRAELGLPLWHCDDCIDRPALTTSMRWAKQRLTIDDER